MPARIASAARAAPPIHLPPPPTPPPSQGPGASKTHRKHARRAELLLACEPCLRHHPHLTLALLPYVLLLLLDSDPDPNPIGAPATPGAAPTPVDDVLREMGCVLSHASPPSVDGPCAPVHGMHGEHPLCCQALFAVLDVLHEWVEQCRSRELDSTRRRIGGFLRRLPAMQLARCALGIGAAYRALQVYLSQ